jgi:hypothetical protein
VRIGAPNRQRVPRRSAWISLTPCPPVDRGDTNNCPGSVISLPRSRTGDSHDATSLCRSGAWIGGWIRRRLPGCIGRCTDGVGMKVESTGASCPFGPSPTRLWTSPDPRDPGDGRRNGGVSFAASRSRAPIPMVRPHDRLGLGRWRMPAISSRTPLACGSRATFPCPGPNHLASLDTAPADDPLKPGQAHP